MKQKSPQFRYPFQDHEDRDFILALMASLFFYTSLVLLIHIVKVPERSREDFKHIPPHIAKLILEVPKPTPRPQAPGQKTASIPKTQEVPKQEPTPQKETKKDSDQKVDKPPSPPSQEEARLRLEQEARALQQRNREVAMQSGLLRLLTKEDRSRSSVKDLTEGKSLEKVLSPVTGLGQLQEPPPQETSEGSRVIKGNGSGGIDSLIAVLKEQGDGAGTGVGSRSLGERRVTRVESPIEIKGSEGEEATRSYESIREVVDALTGWIRFVYNRALRENPTLKGTITLEFEIVPGGDVSRCRVVSTTVKNPALEDQLVKRFQQLKFPPISEGINTVIYPITLVPSG